MGLVNKGEERSEEEQVQTESRTKEAEEQVVKMSRRRVAEKEGKTCTRMGEKIERRGKR